MDSPESECILRSRRRTFLFNKCLLILNELMTPVAFCKHGVKAVGHVDLWLKHPERMTYQIDSEGERETRSPV